MGDTVNGDGDGDGDGDGGAGAGAGGLWQKFLKPDYVAARTSESPWGCLCLVSAGFGGQPVQ